MVAIQDARKAYAEGNMEGVEEGKARIRALVAKSKASQKLRAEAKALKAKIKKELKKGLPKKDKSGKPTGALGADAHEIMARLYAMTKFTQKGASEELERRLLTYAGEHTPDHIEALENRILTIMSSNLFSVTEEDVQLWKLTLDDIKTEKWYGKGS